MNTKRLHTTILGLLSLLIAYATPYCDVRKFSILDGLAANGITDLCQNPDNLMWFSTWNGLSYYDGYTFHTFRDGIGKQDILSTNRLMFLRTCTNNNVWCISADYQLYLYNTHTCEFEKIGKEIEDKYKVKLKVKDIYSLNNGISWIIPENKSYLVRMKGQTVDNKNIDFIKIGQKGLFSGNIWFIRVDKKGREWVLTDKGTFIYGNKFQTHIPFKWFREVGKDIFLSTTDGRLAIYNEQGQLTMIPLPSGVTRINELKNTGYQLLIATNIGLIIYNPRTFKTEVINVQSPSQPIAEVKKAYVDAYNQVWTFTDGMGVTLIDPKTGSKQWLFADANSPMDRTASDKYFITQDSHNTLWVIPNKGTFSYYDRKNRKLVPYLLRSNSSGNFRVPQIVKFFLSDQGILWVVGQQDLTQVNFKNHFYTLNQLDEGETEVRSLASTSNGERYTGFRNGIVKVTDSNNQKLGYLTSSGQLSPLQTPLSPNGIYTMQEDSKNRMWIGTKGDGLYLRQNGILTHFTYDPKDPNSIPCNRIYDIMPDRQGRTWIATYGAGLAVIEETKDGRIKFISNRNGLNWPKANYQKVRCLECTTGGEILVGTTDGLVTFKDDFKQYSMIKFYKTNHLPNDTTSLASNDVNFINIRSNGTVLVSTIGGALNTLTGNDLLKDNLHCKFFRNINIEEGIVQSMVEDNQGNLWIIREASIDKYAPKTGKIEVFGPNDFDFNMTFTEAKPIHDPATDNITVGTPIGSLTFNPTTLKQATYQPKIAFTTLQFIYNNQTETYPILHKEKIVVPADKRNLSISFAVLDYSRKYQVRYQYRIDGSTPEGKWINIGGRNVISFNRISAGKYVLKVKATNTHGVWSNYVAELPLEVRPTFWESIWGRLLLLIILSGAVVGAVYTYNQRQRLNMNHELSIMKNNFFSDAAHRLRTPLSLIGSPVTEVLERESNLSEEGRNLLMMVKRNAYQMLDMLNNILKVDNNSNFYVDGGIDSIAHQEAQTDSEENQKLTENASPTSLSDNIDDNNVPEIMDEAESLSSSPKQNGDKDTTILVVEDNEDLRLFLQTILQEKYNVLLAKNGRIGLQMAQKMMPDFILTDVTMPIMDGITMIHEIKKDTNISHIPIVILSAKASVEDHLKGYEEGIDAYLTKPFSATYLKGRIEAVINQRHNLQQEMLKQIQEKENEEFLISRTKFLPKEDMEQPESENMNSTPQEMEMVKHEGRSVMNLTIKDKTTEKIVKFITENIDDTDLKIDDIAQAMGMSRSVLYGKIKNAVGMTPVDFVRHIRIMRATELLKQTDDPLSSIAFSVGFSDPKYFSKVFKKEMGIIPSDYRERMKKV